MGVADVFAETGSMELQALRDGAKAAFAIHLVSMVTGVSAREIAQGTRARNPAARARWLAMYLLHTSLGVPMMRVGAAFGRDRTTVSQVLGRIENWRSDPDFEAMLTALERCAAAAPMPAPSHVLTLEDSRGCEARA